MRRNCCRACRYPPRLPWRGERRALLSASRSSFTFVSRVCFPARCHLFVASGRHACDDILRRAHGCDRTAPAMVSGSMG